MSKRVKPGRPTGTPPFETELLWALIAQTRAEEQAGGPRPFYTVLNAVMRAQRMVVTKPLVNLAESIRTNDLGVTVTSLEKAASFPGNTWLEWDADVEGRDEPLPHQTRFERLGVLIEADASGHRGRMTVLVLRQEPGARKSSQFDMLPLSGTFDLRENFDRPETICASASFEEAERMLAAVVDPTPAEQDCSRALTTLLSRQFGIIDNPYTAALMHEMFGSSAARWYELEAASFRVAIDEILLEVCLAVCVMLVLRTTPLSIVQVLTGTPRAKLTFGLHKVMLGYGIMYLGSDSSLARSVQPQPRAS